MSRPPLEVWSLLQDVLRQIEHTMRAVALTGTYVPSEVVNRLDALKEMIEHFVEHTDTSEECERP